MSDSKPSPISHKAVLAQLEPIVADTSPYRPSFSSEARHRHLLWGFDVPLHEKGFACLCRALHTVDEESFIYGQIERFPDNDDDWIVSCDDYAGYHSVETFVESLLCSVSGSWIILCSSEGHSVAAATSDVFTDALASDVGVKPLEDAVELIDYWREIYDLVPEPGDLRAGTPDWIPSLLENVLEPEVAAAALRHHAARAPAADS